jgi:REP element-mobilizing transposase RayT
MRGIGENIGLEIMSIGGVADHVHILFSLPGTITISTAIQKLKANSSRWMNLQCRGFAWQEGFGAFSVSASQIAATVAYIQNQAQHHRKADFSEEWQTFLRKHGIAVPSLRDSPE